MVSGSPIIAALQNGRMARHQRQEGQAICSTEEGGSSQENQGVDVVSSSGSHSNGVRTTRHGKTAAHHVWTIGQRAMVVKWMKQQEVANGSKHISVRTVRNFPELFRSSHNANITRASRLWKQRSEYPDEGDRSNLRGETSVVSRQTKIGLKRVNLKAREGRGRKRASWVKALHADLRDEFDRLRKLGVKFNHRTLRALAQQLLADSNSEAYSSNMVDPRSGQSLSMRISTRWVQTFTVRFRIVSRAHTGKYLLSPDQQISIEQDVALHLGKMKRMLQSGEVDENDLENADETHFVVNMDNGRTLGFAGESDVKYADVVSAGEGMTMLVRVSGGRDGIIHPPFIVFTNKSRSYPIRGTPDDVPGVAYRTGPKGWIDTTVMPQWLSERRVIRPLPNGRRRILYLDNCSGHNDTPQLQQASSSINTEIRQFPPNCTHLIQPCDSFVIQKIKSAWTRKWELHKLGLIKEGKWKDGSGKLFNPGKRFFLKLAAEAVMEVNKQRDAEGITYARKSMILTGMALNTNGLWEEKQLTPELQRIIQKHRDHFDGRNEAE